MFKFISKLFASEFESLDGVEFKLKYKQTPNAKLLDVRTPAEFKSGTIQGSVNVDVMSTGFKQAFVKLDKSKEYFLFCRSGARSATACKMMSSEGYKVYNLKGGISSWK